MIRTTKQVVQPAFTAFALLCLSLLLGCSTTGGTRLPPVTATATNEALVGKFVWFVVEEAGENSVAVNGLAGCVTGRDDGIVGGYLML